MLPPALHTWDERGGMRAHTQGAQRHPPSRKLHHHGGKAVSATSVDTPRRTDHGSKRPPAMCQTQHAVEAAARTLRGCPGPAEETRACRLLCTTRLPSMSCSTTKLGLLLDTLLPPVDRVRPGCAPEKDPSSPAAQAKLAAPFSNVEGPTQGCRRPDAQYDRSSRQLTRRPP